MSVCVHRALHGNPLIRNMSVFGLNHYAGMEDDAMQERENDDEMGLCVFENRFFTCIELVPILGILADLLTY